MVTLRPDNAYEIDLFLHRNVQTCNWTIKILNAIHVYRNDLYRFISSFFMLFVCYFFFVFLHLSSFAPIQMIYWIFVKSYIKKFTEKNIGSLWQWAKYNAYHSHTYTSKNNNRSLKIFSHFFMVFRIVKKENGVCRLDSNIGCTTTIWYHCKIHQKVSEERRRRRKKGFYFKITAKKSNMNGSQFKSSMWKKKLVFPPNPKPFCSYARMWMEPFLYTKTEYGSNKQFLANRRKKQFFFFIVAYSNTKCNQVKYCIRVSLFCWKML